MYIQWLRISYFIIKFICCISTFKIILRVPGHGQTNKIKIEGQISKEYFHYSILNKYWIRLQRCLSTRRNFLYQFLL